MAVQYIPTVTDFIAAFRTIVACMPKELASECKRINSFAWLWDASELNAENMLATKKKYEKGEFYIRSYERTNKRGQLVTEYPVLAVDIVKSRITSLTPPVFEEIPITLWVWAKYVEKGSGERCEPCEDKTKKELEQDTKFMLNYVINELDDLIYITDGTEKVWVSETFYRSVDNTCYTRPKWTVLCNAKAHIIGGINMAHDFGGAHDLIGTLATFTLRVGRPCKNQIRPDYCNCEEC